MILPLLAAASAAYLLFGQSKPKSQPSGNSTGTRDASESDRDDRSEIYTPPAIIPGVIQSLPAMESGDLPFLSKIPAQYRSEFAARVKEIASDLGVDPVWLMAIMDFESAGTLSPSVTNSLGYTGLIQFGKDAAKDLGTTTAALRQMNHLEQLEYVKKYFAMRKRQFGSLTSFADLYLAVLYPAYIRKGYDVPLRMGQQAKALYNASGQITKRSIVAGFNKRYPNINLS